jgi:hypothetical protein
VDRRRPKSVIPLNRPVAVLGSYGVIRVDPEIGAEAKKVADAWDSYTRKLAVLQPVSLPPSNQAPA